MHNTRGPRPQKRCTIRTCLRLSGPLHRTSTLSHGGEAIGTRTREPYPCPRQRHGSAHTRAPRQRPPHPAPVAQWIEQAPSKRLAAGSSPAGGASLSSPSGGPFCWSEQVSLTRHSPGHSPDDQGAGSGAVRLSPGFRGWPCRIRVEILGEKPQLASGSSGKAKATGVQLWPIKQESSQATVEGRCSQGRGQSRLDNRPASLGSRRATTPAPPSQQPPATSTARPEPPSAGGAPGVDRWPTPQARRALRLPLREEAGS